jgi:hypothetical protein
MNYSGDYPQLDRRGKIIYCTIMHLLPKKPALSFCGNPLWGYNPEREG